MKQLLYLIGILALIVILWNHAILYPLKILVVFFHESSHAIATIVSGGSVKEMVVVFQQGGHVISQGGNQFLILNAGYLGSLVWGFLIYVVATFSNADKLTMMSLGIVVAIITLFFVSNLFAILFGVATVLAMIFSGKYLSNKINDFLLRVIGLTSMIYVPLDIFSDTIYRSNLISDARMLAEQYGGATVIWGGVWLILSLITIFLCLRWTLKKNPETQAA